MANVSCCGCGCGTALPMAVIAGLTNFETDAQPWSGQAASRANAVVVRAIRGYQRHGRLIADCPFQPSCSVYGREAFERYPFAKACIKTGWRLLRCNPWKRGLSFDPP
jgi:putative component of membrane protein insertase Oxa1/YidC/SpoIIIJ protein YidD